MNPQIFTALITLVVGSTATWLTYKNYQLNKTLNIKNHLFNEKLKLYRELSKTLGEFIVLLDDLERIYKETNEDTINSYSIQFKEKSRLINVLIVEGSMLLSKEALVKLTALVNFLYTPVEISPDQQAIELYTQKVEQLRNISENLLKFFRQDLGIRDLIKDKSK